VPLVFDLKGQRDTVTVTLTEEGKLGIALKSIGEMYPVVREKYSLISSVPKGAKMGVDKLTGYVSSLKLIFSKEGAKSVGGFGAIGSIFPEKWNWLQFWEITAFLSVALAIMNILPIPALDGGHVLFLVWEIITRRKPSEKFLEYAQFAGMLFLLILLLYANGNDIYRFLLK
ncbi:MAG: site-2 protease family protein, partial [Muribaculaceae bacterium]|nr:site-2 protease family protein [Muribaculaceae bacterium]